MQQTKETSYSSTFYPKTHNPFNTSSETTTRGARGSFRDSFHIESPYLSFYSLPTTNNSYNNDMMFTPDQQFQYQNHLIQQELEAQQKYIEIQSKTTELREKYYEINLLAATCFNKCITHHLPNKLFLQKNEDLLENEKDCLKECIYKNKNFMNHVWKRMLFDLNSGKHVPITQQQQPQQQHYLESTDNNNLSMMSSSSALLDTSISLTNFINTTEDSDNNKQQE
ncbi:hypothetical protein ABK040_001282 [Willaertia magna]